MINLTACGYLQRAAFPKIAYQEILFASLKLSKMQIERWHLEDSDHVTQQLHLLHSAIGQKPTAFLTNAHQTQERANQQQKKKQILKLQMDPPA